MKQSFSFEIITFFHGVNGFFFRLSHEIEFRTTFSTTPKIGAGVGPQEHRKIALTPQNILGEGTDRNVANVDCVREQAHKTESSRRTQNAGNATAPLLSTSRERPPQKGKAR